MSNQRTTRPPARRKPPADTVSFMGATYKVAEKIGIWPQLQLARAAQEGVTLGDMRSLAAVHATLENVIDPADWPRFEADMIAKKSDDLEKLLDLVGQCAQVVASRAGRANGNGQAVRGEVITEP